MSRLSAPTSATGAHDWRFFRASGLDQACIDTAEDFRNLASLDQKLWVALSCPTRGLNLDERTLAFIDGDADGRIRAPELIAAVQWTCRLLKDPAVLADGSAVLSLSAIDDTSGTGAQILASARRVLKAAGRPDATAISIEDLADRAKILGQLGFNGDGVLDSLSLGGDAALQQVFVEIAATVGVVKDLSGRDGVDEPLVARFFEQLQAYEAWAVQAEQVPLPLGLETPAALTALQAVSAKITDYFARCQLAAFDPRAAAPLSRTESEFAAVAGLDLSKANDAVSALPLARIEAGRGLPLADGVNPAWIPALAGFRRQVVEPLLGPGCATLTHAEWIDLLARFAPFATHAAAKPAGAVDKLGRKRCHELLASNLRARLVSLIQEDRSAAPDIAAIDSVDRLVRYHRDLGRLLNNFVSFRDFYSADRQASFQAGTLYLDGRSCELCVQVGDPDAHAALASNSNLCIAYCACRRADGATMKIAACFTQGDSDYLMVGRNGIFYDCQGRDWDATIVKMLENSISLRQAFWLPYKKLARFIEGQAERFAAAKDKSAAQLASGAVPTVPDAGPPAKAEAFDIGKFAAIFAAVGLALGYIGGALASIAVGFVKLAPWQMPLAVLGAVLLVSVPSVLLAWLKLRQRTLGPVLDGTGWAVNGRVRINVPLGTALTHLARVPTHARLSLKDPFEDKAAARRQRWMLIFLIFAVLVTAAWNWRDSWWWRVAGDPPPARDSVTAPAIQASPAGKPAPATAAP